MTNLPIEELAEDETSKTVLTADDIEETSMVLENMKTAATNLSNKVRVLVDRLGEGQLPTDKGISFLDTKNQLLSQYILDLSAMAASKACGQSIADSANIDRLIRMRVYLERLRPVQLKLNYQIDKLVKIATQGGLAVNDPLHLKPNPENMGNESDEQSDSGEIADATPGLEKVTNTNVYKPPKMASAYYEEEATGLEDSKKAEMKAKKKALNSALIRELREEYSEAPTEIVDDFNAHRLKASKSLKDQTDYEESYFVRLRKGQPKATDMATDKYLGTLASFGDTSALTGERSRKKRKTSSKTKRFLSKKKKR